MSTDLAAAATLGGSASACFGGQLRRWRQQRRWSQRELGIATHFSREYVALIERGQRRPTAAFAQRAEAALGTGGVLLCTFAEFEQSLVGAQPRRAPRRRPRSAAAKAAVTLRRGVSQVVAGRGQDFDTIRPAPDDLLDAVRADLDTDDVSRRLDELEFRYAELLGEGDGRLPLEDLVYAAALAVEDCHAILSSPVVGSLAERSAAVTARFARLVADSLAALQLRADAQGWYDLAASVCRAAGTDPDQAPQGRTDAITTTGLADPTIRIDHAEVTTQRRPTARSRPASPAHCRPVTGRRLPRRSRLHHHNVQADKIVNGVRGGLPVRPPRRSPRAPPANRGDDWAEFAEHRYTHRRQLALPVPAHPRGG